MVPITTQPGVKEDYGVRRVSLVNFRARVGVRVRSGKRETRLHWPLVMLKDSWTSTVEGVGGGCRVRVRFRATVAAIVKVKVAATILNYPILVLDLIRQRLTENSA